MSETFITDVMPVNVNFSGRNGRIVTFRSTVSTANHYRRYRYGGQSNDHNIREGFDQSVNYFARTVVKTLNNAFKREDVFAYGRRGVVIIFQRHEKAYYLNGNKVTKSKLNSVVPSILMNLNIVKSQNQMDLFIDRIINTDPVIAAAIVNKIEYTFYDSKSGKIVTLLNLEKTSVEHSAIELYEGMWVEFKDTQMKSFINSCKGNKNKFLGISPEELYYLSRKEFLSPLEIKTVYAFLSQNRKSSLVQRRSMELFENLTKTFKGRIFSREVVLEENGEPKKSMAVSGKQCDWLVVDNGYKAGRQDVSTYLLLSMENYNWDDERDSYVSTKTLPVIRGSTSLWRCKDSGDNFYAIGPICIDQQHNNVSLGDQFAARSMALLNDTSSFKLVSTLRGYQTYHPEHRVDWNAVSVLLKYQQI